MSDEPEIQKVEEPDAEDEATRKRTEDYSVTVARFWVYTSISTLQAALVEALVDKGEELVEQLTAFIRENNTAQIRFGVVLQNHITEPVRFFWHTLDETSEEK